MKKKAAAKKAVKKVSVKSSTRPVAKMAKKSVAKVSRRKAPEDAKKSSSKSSALYDASLADDLAALRRRRFNA